MHREYGLLKRDYLYYAYEQHIESYYNLRARMVSSSCTRVTHASERHTANNNITTYVRYYNYYYFFFESDGRKIKVMFKFVVRSTARFKLET